MASFLLMFHFFSIFASATQQKKRKERKKTTVTKFNVFAIDTRRGGVGVVV